MDVIKNTIEIFEHPEEKEVPEAEKEGLEAKDPTGPSEDQLQFNRIQY